MLNVNFEMRNEGKILGIADHIEEAFEATVVFKDGEKDHFEIINKKRAKEELLSMLKNYPKGLEDVEKAYLISHVRKWENEYPSKWVEISKKEII